VHAPTPWQWRSILTAALAIVVLWPPAEGRSLGVMFVNWAADPAGELPVLPPQLPMGAGDDPYAVERRDDLVRRYDALWAEGGWTRRRLQLKVAREPLAPSTLRQLLLAAAVVLAAITWRVAAGSTNT
jgi:hypothetical protein